MTAHPLRTLRLLLILTALMLAGMTAAFLLRPSPGLASHDGTLALGGGFELESIKGPVSLADFRGHPVVLYFGYTSCPDVCPTSLAILAQAFRKLDDRQQEQVRGIFISVDPMRDTPAKLAQYVALFHPNLVGLTGTRTQIDKVVHEYGAYYQITRRKDPAFGYAVDHSSRFYLIDKQGQLAAILGHAVTADEIAAKLRPLF